MVKNPDVSVRMRGVMEKCTYCLQRIEQAKIAQKSRRAIRATSACREGWHHPPACAQACPAGAIVFGDISDPDSRVSQVKQQSRNYAVLDFLTPSRALTYLARVRNPNRRCRITRNNRCYSYDEYTKAHGEPAGGRSGKGGR